MSQNYKLLIVDDEPGVTLTLKLIFEREGYQVTPAYTCAEALQLFRDGHGFDGVITDLNMEREDIGLEVVRAAQQIEPRPAIVICTGYANGGNAQAALDMKVDYLATKPVDLQQLLHSLEMIMRRRYVQRARA